MRGRPGDTAVAALAALAAMLAATTLVQSGAWFVTAVWLVLLVGALGVGLRQINAPEPLVVLGQLVGVAVAMAWTFASSSTFYGIPTPATATRVGELLHEFVSTVYTATAPLPATPGVTLVFVLVAGVVALVVDDVAVTRRAPAAAGVALLAVFLAAAANSGASLSPVFFLAAAVAWLALVARDHRARMRLWSTTSSSADTPTRTADVERTAVLGFGSAARRLGLAAIVFALAVPAVVPHLPTRFLLDGLARGSGGAGTTATAGFSSTLDVSRSLRSGLTTEVLRYRTNAPTAEPLRVLATSAYDGTAWTAPTPSLGRATRLELSPQVERAERVITVEDNTMDPPRLAAPQPVVAADLRGTSWSVDEQTSDIYAQTRPESYSITYLDPKLTPTLLRDGLDGRPGADPLPSGRQLGLSLRVDPRSEAAVRAAAQEAAGSATTAYDAAMAIQDWLRDDSRFTYSLTLASDPAQAGLDPITSFLRTRTGYCVQFASAMVMMSRVKGIPARMAIGFLPGERDQSGAYTVSDDDAHAWPELYFAGAGWVRFEPTPQVRTGTAPEWTLPAAEAASSVAGGTSAGGTSDPSGRNLDRDLDSGLDGTNTDIEQPVWDQVRLWFSQPAHVLLIGLLLGVTAALVLPATSLLLRRRRHRRRDAPSRVEAQWADLTSRLADLGLPSPAGGSLRDWESHYQDAASLDEHSRSALHQVVATVETSRYARPGTGVFGDLSPQVGTVTRAVARTRSKRRRVRALLLPGDGVRWWRQVGHAAMTRARAISARLRRPARRPPAADRGDPGW
ncbi:MAG: transglutaminaseTgpA domain-containing protein [Dermatophilaceae bacterium]